VSLVGATVSVTAGSQEYTGKAITIPATGISVTLNGTSLSAGEDFEVAGFSKNTDAGRAEVTVKGIGAYKDSEKGTFEIRKKALTVEDLDITYTTSYNGKEQPIRVVAKSGLSGIGGVKTAYTPADVARKEPGSWTVRVAVEEGKNFLALDSVDLATPYTITRAMIEPSMVNVSGLPKVVKWNGENQGIAKPTLKGVAALYDGDWSVAYDMDGYVTEEAVDSGVYNVIIRVEGNEFFGSGDVILGTLTIKGLNDAVVEVAREIPNGAKVEQAAVAPVKVVAGEVTAGPSPVAAGGEVAIFWNGSKTVSGKLAVFSAAGKKVAAVPVSGSRKIGAWSTAGVTEGTYLVKGVVVTKDGSKVKVTAPVAVTK
jgi:hypothetical protein